MQRRVREPVNRGIIRPLNLVLLISLATADCASTPPVQETSAPAQSDAEISLIPVTCDQWQKELEARKGNIVVVDMWATWCIPCLERFPHMVEMHREYSGRGVTFISMCLDDRTDELALKAAQEFLLKQNATFSNFRLDEDILDAFDKLGLQGVPAVFVYDRCGELRHRLTMDDPNHQFTSADVEKAIQTLLNEQ